MPSSTLALAQLQWKLSRIPVVSLPLAKAQLTHKELLLQKPARRRMLILQPTELKVSESIPLQLRVLGLWTTGHGAHEGYARAASSTCHVIFDGLLASVHHKVTVGLCKGNHAILRRGPRFGFCLFVR
jgi:hypothetical protein